MSDKVRRSVGFSSICCLSCSSFFWLIPHFGDSLTKTFALKNDAVRLLDADHIAVKKMFTGVRKLCDDDASADEKRDLAAQICKKLTLHAQIEEEMFFPEMGEAIDGNALFDEAGVELTTAMSLIGQIAEMSPDEDLHDAKVTVVGEYINHHVKKEREEICKGA